MSTPVNPRDSSGELRRVSSATLDALAGRNKDPQRSASLLATTPVEPDSAALRVWRGRVDALALKLKFSDAAVHAQFTPARGDRRELLFDQLEQCRVEAVGAVSLPGLRSNLAALQASCANLPAAALLSAARLRFGAPLAPADAARLSADWRAGIDTAAARRLDAMVPLLHDQAAYAQHAHALIELLHLPGDEQANALRDAQAPERHEDGSTKPAPAPPAVAEGEAEPAQLGILRRIGAEPRGIVVAQEIAAPAGAPGYHAYTREYDAVWDAHESRDAGGRAELDAEIGERLDRARANFARWAHRLQRHLLVRQMRAWQFDQEEGVLDAARLTRVVTDPLQPLLFKAESAEDFPLTAVTLLLDCSGSMRGLPIATAAGCTELLAAVLERCGVRVEILGFTTRHWRGGNSRETWLADGRPDDPGRLTDLLHVVFKRGDTAWRRARPSLAAMLDEKLLKENVDGEALLWAHERLLRRPEPRRILMVVSDGAPLDDATLAANDAGYLDRHLRAVIRDIERRGAVELLAIGIGHNVGAYYPRSFTVTGPENLGEAIVTQLIALLDRPARGRNRKARAATA
jgi:cobaltochelatase CobT